MKYTAQQVAGMIDHTNLKAFALTEDIRKLCREAAENRFKSVCVNPVFVKLCREELKDSGYTLISCTRDLHADEELMKDNVMTEYEERFSSQGNRINRYLIRV